ncbi:MAG TPA: TIGR03088 family PEP-CTERM/XrtA system glycosyltransferase [Candidatus Limnocylindrales bacterium]|nr:TIGR03088 family PEP-CTERM/XrtA system glycosyltransferase [Candidatus Limnocylindrales bacterium]
MKSIKIMHVLTSLNIGGLENGVVNLINKMDPDKFKHMICCISRSGQSAEKLIRKDVEIFEMKKGEARELLLPLRVARLFRKVKVDIVHTRNWGAIDGIIGAKLAGIPIVVHGEHGRDITDPYGTNKKKNLIRKGLSCFVDGYITVSKELKEWLVDKVGIKGEKVHVIYNGVDTVKFNPYDKGLIRAKYNYTDRDIILGTVGRLDPIKDQQLLIKAFAQLNARYYNSTLLIIGDGPCWRDLEKLANDLGIRKSVRFLGARMDVAELLKLLDIFVLPSLAEGISNTILEAMATGIPVVATHVGGNPELVVNGETGYLFPKEDLATLLKVLEGYILNPAIMKEHGMAGRQRVVNRFSLDRMVANYESFYTHLMMETKNN